MSMSYRGDKLTLSRNGDVMLRGKKFGTWRANGGYPAYEMTLDDGRHFTAIYKWRLYELFEGGQDKIRAQLGIEVPA